MASEAHERLVATAAKWLKRNGFGVVATELKCHGSREEPDAIGFRVEASAVVEVKVSRADFLADAKKPERRKGGLGLYRFYLCPVGLIQPEELPERWGLLYANGRRVESVVAPLGNAWLGPAACLPNSSLSSPAAANWLSFQHDPDPAAERSALYSIARRAQAGQ